MKKIILLFILTLFLIHSTTALGVKPGLYELPYVPGNMHNLDFYILGSGIYNVTLEGQSLLVNNTQISQQGLVDASKNNNINLKLTIPTLSPGKNILKVMISEVPPIVRGRQAAMSAIVAVGGQVIIRVPFPNKYLDAKLTADNAAVGTTAFFDVEVNNRGSKTIDEVSGHINLLDPENSLVDKLPLTTVEDFMPGDYDVIYAEWTPTNQSPGIYKANATVTYDGQETNSYIEFVLGDIFVDIQNIITSEIHQGDVAKITVDAKSKWNQPLTTYAVLEVNDIEVQSPTLDLQPWRSGKFPLFLDTKTLNTGNYTGKVTLFYQDRTTEETIDIEVKEPSLEPKATVTKSINFSQYFDQIIITTLIIVIIAIFIGIQKKKKQNQPKPMQQLYRYMRR